MSNKVKTTNDIQNQNDQNMLKFWQGTEDESSKQNVTTHEDYLCFINGVGIKIGNKLIIKNNKKIDVTPDTPTIDPTSLKFGDRIDNKATVVGTFESSDLGTVVFAVLDSTYYGKTAWATGLYGIDTGLPNYASDVNVLNAKESATYNTDYILNNYSDKKTEAFTHCRNIEPLNFNGKKYYGQLPNAYELQQIYNNREKLYELDPTTADNTNYNLAKWQFIKTSDVDEKAWSSNEYLSDTSWEQDSLNTWNYSNGYSKNYICGVCPIIEIPISNNTPSEETSKEFTITSNADNATILVNEVQ